MAANWRVYRNHTVASKLDRSDLPGFFRKKVIVGPGEAALVLRDGELEEFLTESKATVSGILDNIASLFGLGADISVYFADLTPINLTIYLGESTKERVALQGEVQAAAAGSTEQVRKVDLLSGKEVVGWNVEVEQNAEYSGSESNITDVSQICILALTADKEIIQAACHVRLCVDPQHARKFVGMLKGKKALATWDLSALLRDELFAKVLIPEIANHKAEDFRGNKKILDHLESLVHKELQRSLADCGLLLDSFTVSWGLTESEQAEIQRRRAEQEEEALEFANQRRLAHMAREQEIDKTHLANLQEIQKADAAGDEELKKLLLAGEIERDLMVTGKGIDEAQIAAKIRDIELEVDRKESLARLEKDRAQADLQLELEDRAFKEKHAREHAARLKDVDARERELDAEEREMQSMVDMQIKMATEKHNREIAKRRHETEAEHRKLTAELEDRYQQRKIKLDESRDRMAMMERLVDKGLDKGATDASVLKTMLEQSTEQEYATTSDEMVKARSEAQAAANNLDTHRQAQADERAHQANMTHLSAQMMQAAKQNPITTGGGSVPQQPQQPAGQPIIMNVTPQGPAPPAPQSASAPCGNCGSPIQPGWKACPSCGTAVAASAPGNCPGCGGAVQPGWKACPNCGQSLAAAAKAFCTGCGGEMQPNWKACPNCGTPS